MRVSRAMEPLMAADHLPTDAVLLQMHGPQPAWDDLTQRIAATPIFKALGASIGRCAWSAPSATACVYLELPDRIAVSKTALAPLANAAGSPASPRLARLALMRGIDGASRNESALFHYVVAMTPESGFEVELQRWYDAEHLPGLAAVPGCVQARRFWNHDTGARSMACYDLADEHAMGSPAWLAVRHTAWSDRMRPRFMDTVRTMFSVVR